MMRLVLANPFRRPRGFTFVELMMGLVITSLVLGALSAFTYAMTAAWKQSDSLQLTHMGSNQATVRIQNVIQQAKLIGLVRPGSLTGTGTAAAMMYWANDNSADGKIQFAEMGLL